MSKSIYDGRAGLHQRRPTIFQKRIHRRFIFADFSSLLDTCRASHVLWLYTDGDFSGTPPAVAGRVSRVGWWSADPRPASFNPRYCTAVQLNLKLLTLPLDICTTYGQLLPMITVCTSGAARLMVCTPDVARFVGVLHKNVTAGPAVAASHVSLSIDGGVASKMTAVWNYALKSWTASHPRIQSAVPLKSITPVGP